MIEINRETKNSMMDVFKYIHKIHSINPGLSVPRTFISPASSMNKYGFMLQTLNAPLSYLFIAESIYKISEVKIKNGEEILKVLKKRDECYLETLYDNFLCDSEDYEDLCISSLYEMFCDDDMISKEIIRREKDFIEFLSKEEVVKVELKIPFINKFSDNIVKIMEYIVTHLTYDLVGYGGERVLDYHIDQKTCIITIWSATDFPPVEQIWEDPDIFEEIFMNVLRDEAL